MRRKLLLSLLLAVQTFWCAAQTQPPVYLDEDQPIEQRIEDAIGRMTLEEKIGVIHAQSKFSSAGVPRLGIPDVWCTDGPHGIRPEVLWDEWDQAGWTNDYCTAFPALTCLAATWNPEMSALYGKSIGAEARYREKDVLLGPGVNICRSPLNGRNFEYMGEDPLLASKMVVPYIKGVQSNGVAACVKHFALNNQEQYRDHINVIVSDRALYEIYLPAFHAAIDEGGAWAIMPAYNKYKGLHCCHNTYLLNDILKGEWGFDGVTISDWGGTHDTKEAVLGGLDMEFGTWTNGLNWSATNSYDNYFMAKTYLQMIQSGQLSTAELDDKVRRVLRLIFRTAMNTRKPFGALNSDEGIAAARRIGGEGVVLLKNENGVLPIDLATTKRILVVGENAIKMMTVGGGSSSLKVKREVVPLEGIRNYVGTEAEVVYERGYVGDVTGEYNGVKTGQDLKDKRSKKQLVADAVAEARKADAVIFIGGLNKSNHQDCEGADRLAYRLPYNQNELIEALVAANRNLVVLNISGCAVEMPWIDRLAALMQTWYLGSEAGNAIADVLFGEVNPSGHLPFTVYRKLEDCGAHSFGQQWSGNGVDVNYPEDIYVGYRWTDKQNIKTLFPFGYGLSYTTFEISKPTISANTLSREGTLEVGVEVANTGNCAGSEVVQLYIGDRESSLPRPSKELKAFKKVNLAAGESATVKFLITPDELKFFDDKAHRWVAEKGDFKAYVATSSEEIKFTLDFALSETVLF